MKTSTEIQSITLAPWFLDLINANIEITITKHHHLGLMFDLHSGAKSHLYLVHALDGTPEGAWFAHMRYDVVLRIRTFEDLLAAVLEGMHGRTFINQAWADLLVKHGYTLPT